MSADLQGMLRDRRELLDRHLALLRNASSEGQAWICVREGGRTLAEMKVLEMALEHDLTAASAARE